jgi:hypothetical protein
MSGLGERTSHELAGALEKCKRMGGKKKRPAAWGHAAGLRMRVVREAEGGFFDALDRQLRGALKVPYR